MISPFEKIVFPFILGIICPYYLDNVELLLFVAVLSIIISFVIGFKFNKSFIQIGIVVSFFVLGIWQSNLNLTFKRNDYFAKQTYEYVIGSINSSPKETDKFYRFNLNVKQGIDADGQVYPVSGILSVLIYKDESNLAYFYGDELWLPANYKKIEQSRLPSTFDYKKYMFFKDIHYQLFAGPEEIILLNTNTLNPVYYWALQFREQLKEKLTVLFRSAPNLINFFSAILLGDKTQLDENTISTFTATGTIHILSISGVHVLLISSFISFFLSLFVNKVNRKSKIYSNLLTILFVWVYIFITGMSIPACRAGLMISVFLMGYILQKKHFPYNTLFATAFFQLMFAPETLFSIGFQLSYIAVWGLLVIFPFLKKMYYSKKFWVKKLLDVLYVSFAAQLSILFISLFYFKYFPLYFLLSNVFLAFPIAIIMYVGITLMFLPIWMSEFIISLFTNFVEFVIYVMQKIAALPYAYDFSVYFNFYEVLLSSLVLFVVFRFRFRLFYKIVLGLMCLIIFSVNFYWERNEIANQKEFIKYKYNDTEMVVLVQGDEGYYFVNDENAFLQKKIKQLNAYYRLSDVYLFPIQSVELINFPFRNRFYLTSDIEIVRERNIKEIKNAMIYAGKENKGEKIIAILF